jgi:hypothetical protein
MLTLDEALPLFEAALNDDHDRSALTIKVLATQAGFIRFCNNHVAASPRF